MRIDIISIFPAYLDPVRLSLIGKAHSDGLLSVHVHDLRDFTHDRHRTVDDTPYGGGPGMVMMPQPWGEALDAVRDMDPADPLLVVPAPAGYPFTQERAQEWSHLPRLVIACGRYEGIDSRVAEHYAHAPGWAGATEVTIGDYVLAGGEAAALVMVEAVGRLLPGVLGNSHSASDDSFSKHGEPALEGPVFTKPPRWRDREVPQVLLSGDHGRIEQWRREQAAERTRERRPDLL